MAQGSDGVKPKAQQMSKARSQAKDLSRKVALQLRQQGESLGNALPPLLVEADRVAASVAQGVHGRRRVGQGEAFWQFRDCQAGDSVQAIDWRQSAKTDQHYVRQNEWEAAQTLWLWVDQSNSMNYSSHPRLQSKSERAALLLMALANLLSRAGEHFALLGGEESPTTGKLAVDRLTQALLFPLKKAKGEMSSGEGASDQHFAALPLTVNLPRHSSLVWITDLFMEQDVLFAAINRFAAMGVTGTVVQLLDPAEETLPFQGRVLFEGLEGEARLTLSHVEAARQDYQNRLLSERQTVADYLHHIGWRFMLHHTDRPAQEGVLALHMALSASLATGRFEKRGDF